MKARIGIRQYFKEFQGEKFVLQKERKKNILKTKFKKILLDLKKSTLAGVVGVAIGSANCYGC